MTSHKPAANLIGLFLAIFAGGIFVTTSSTVQGIKKGSSKIFAQKVVEDTLAAHPEIEGLELATTPPDKTECETIASNELKEIGEKCDRDELTVMKTQEPFVEKETEHGREIYDVTLAIHDSKGDNMATAGMDFKPGPDQNQAKVVEQAKRIAKELESKITSKEKLFQPVE